MNIPKRYMEHSLLSKKLGIHLSKISAIKDIEVSTCYNNYEKQNISVNEIILNNVIETSLLEPPISANKSLIRNIIFIIYLYLNQHNEFKELKSLITNYNTNNNITNNTTNNTTNSKKNNKKNNTKQNNNDLNTFINEYKSKKYNTNSFLKGGDNKDQYKLYLNKLKKEYRKNFIEWFCKYIYVINQLKKLIHENLSKKIINLSGSKKIDLKMRQLIKIFTTLDKDKKIIKFGDNYNYILITGLILKILRINNNILYQSLVKNINNTINNISYTQKYIKKLPIPSLIEMLIYQINLYVKADLISYPIKEVYTNFDELDHLGNCYSGVLNYTYFFRYFLSLYSVAGNKKNIRNLIVNGNQTYILKDLVDLDTTVGKPFLGKLAKFLGINTKINIENKLKKIMSNRGNMYFWIFRDYLILSAEVSKKNIKLSAIGIELTDDNKIVQSKYNTKVVDVNFFIGFRNKYITINCLTKNKKNLGQIKISLYKGKETQNKKNTEVEDLIVSMKNIESKEDEMKYNIVKTNNGYDLYQICPKMFGGIYPKIINYKNVIDKKNIKTLEMKTEYNILPIDLVLGFIIGVIIKTDNRFGGLISNARNKVIDISNIKCERTIV